MSKAAEDFVLHLAKIGKLISGLKEENNGQFLMTFLERHQESSCGISVDVFVDQDLTYSGTSNGA